MNGIKKMDRRNFLQLAGMGAAALAIGCVSLPKGNAGKRPNILLAISDDQSHVHTSFGGSKFINTPAFDRVAKEGVYFTNCYAGSPGCAPSRSSLVTGRHHWQNESSGQHQSPWLKKYVPFVDEIEKNGYAVGRTGKGVSPFQYARDENDTLWREENSAGIAHGQIKYNKENDERPAKAILNNNYFENFKYFLNDVREDRPFFFWYGGKEPHRKFEKDSWKRHGKKLEDVDVPGFLPDNEIVRGDLLDYAVEVEWFDEHLQRMLDHLEEMGELDNTIVIVTSDNGMAFPRAKANNYEYGMQVPLAIRYPKGIPAGRVSETLVSFIDFAPTLLEATRTKPESMMPITGASLWSLLTSGSEDMNRSVFAGRERHSSSRYKNWGYPQRSVRHGDYLFTWNPLPERWPAGAPQAYSREDSTKLEPMLGLTENEDDIGVMSFTDIGASPTKTYLIKNHDDEEIAKYLKLACEKRPEFELFNVVKDEACIHNLAGQPEYAETEERLRNLLFDELTRTEDPRVSEENFGIFDTYKRYKKIRKFPEPTSETLEQILQKD